MGEKRLPNIGTRVQMEWIDVRKSNDMKYLRSKIMDMIDEHTMIIATPTYKNISAPIPVDAQIKVNYFRKNLGIYGFYGKVIERKNSEGLSYLKIKRMGDIFRIQRRDFYRLSVVLSGKMKIMNQKSESMISFFTKDISGGGLRIISKEKVEKNTMVEVMIEIGQKLIVVKGEILRCISSQEIDGYYDIGIIFKEIDEKHREEIISFIFEYERKMRQKGIGLDG